MTSNPHSHSHMYERRAGDSKRQDIEAMIAEENDPKQRAFLIILNSINQSLVANTVATASLSEKFDNHLTAFEEKVQTDAELLNQGKGMWKAIAWVMGAAQAIGLSLAAYVVRDLSDIHRDLQASRQAETRLELRIDALEKHK